MVPNLNWSTKNQRAKPAFIEHTLATTDIMIALREEVHHKRRQRRHAEQHGGRDVERGGEQRSDRHRNEGEQQQRKLRRPRTGQQPGPGQAPRQPVQREADAVAAQPQRWDRRRIAGAAVPGRDRQARAERRREHGRPGQQSPRIGAAPDHPQHRRAEQRAGRHRSGGHIAMQTQLLGFDRRVECLRRCRQTNPPRCCARWPVCAVWPGPQRRCGGRHCCAIGGGSEARSNHRRILMQTISLRRVT